jgi:hypothetical protein
MLIVRRVHYNYHGGCATYFSFLQQPIKHVQTVGFDLALLSFFGIPRCSILCDR